MIGEEQPHSWRAEEKMLQLRQMLRESRDHIRINYIGREQILASHDLANVARRMRHEYKGITNPSLISEHQISEEINRGVFKVFNNDDGD
jgi:hypothetical protein